MVKAGMIETENLRLRRPEIDDLDAIHAMRSDLDVVRFLGGRALNREEAWHRLMRLVGHWALRGYGMFAVVEKGSGVTIYRRPMPIQIHRRVIRFETSLYPLWRMDNAIGHQFQYFEKGLERFGRETVTQMFLLNHYSSILLSGRIAYKNFSMYIEENFDGLCLIQNPYEELAERLLVLARMSEIGAQHLGERDAMRLAPAIAFAASLDFEDEKKLKKAMLAMPMDVAQLLANPLVRQFTTTTPDEMPSGNAVASTLDILAHFAVVGTRDFAYEYTEAVGAMLGTDPSVIPQIWTFEKVRSAGELIRRIRVVDHLIEKDLAVYAQVHRALAELARSV